MPDWRTMPVPVLARRLAEMPRADGDAVIRALSKGKRRELERFLEKELGRAQVAAARARLLRGG